MIYLLVPLVALVITHIIKFIVFVLQKRNFVGNRLWWSFMWLGNFPSVHSASLSSILYLIWVKEGFSLLFTLGVVVSVIITYGLFEDKKRQTLYEHYFLASNNEALIKISKDGVLMDFSGHTALEMFSGAVIGVTVAAIAVQFFIK